MKEHRKSALYICLMSYSKMDQLVDFTTLLKDPQQQQQELIIDHYSTKRQHSLSINSQSTSDKILPNISTFQRIFSLSRIKNQVISLTTSCCTKIRINSNIYFWYKPTGSMFSLAKWCLVLLLSLMSLLCLDLVNCYDPFSAYNKGRNYELASGGGYGTFTDAYQHHHQQAQHHHQQYNQYGISIGANDYAPHYPNTYAPYRKYYKQYLPGPQFCPETGRTVCSKVTPFYPIDEVFSVVKMARAKRFNISSEFVDESENDAEPHFEIDEPFPEPEPFLSSPPQHLSHFGQVHPGLVYGHTEASHVGFSKPIAHFHNFDYKPYFGGKHDFRATVSPPYHHKTIYSSSYSAAPINTGISYTAAASSATMIDHARYKRQTVNGNEAGDQIPIEPICPSRIILIEPKAALNDRRQWKFIINLSERDPRLKQAIKVEVCT